MAENGSILLAIDIHGSMCANEKIRQGRTLGAICFTIGQKAFSR
jgi:hypothetical protein